MRAADTTSKDAGPSRRSSERGWLKPAVLLLLCHGPAHGYELWTRLETVMPTADPPANPGSLYRLLRSLEAAGAVSSEWRQSTAGPKRRVYAITSKGRDELDDWAHLIERDATAARRFLRLYRSTQYA
jgi:DNA-binding PadR family transcriptional regulator